MKPTLTDVTRRAFDAAESFGLSPSARILLLYGIIQIWNQQRRPFEFSCRQDLLTGYAGLSPSSFKKGRRELFELDLIDWKQGERNARAARYSLGIWFYSDRESGPDERPESNPDSGHERGPFTREREEAEKEKISPVVPSGDIAEEKALFSPEFLSFWQAFPKKAGKKAAWREWKKATKETDLEAVLSAIESQKHSKQWLDGFIPNPARWLREGRWEDDTAPARRELPDQF